MGPIWPIKCPYCPVVPEGVRGENVNAARKYLIPFPVAPAKSPGIDDTVYAMPRPEFLFEPARPKFNFTRINFKRISIPKIPIPSIPRSISRHAWVASIAAAVLLGVVVGRLTARPAPYAPITSAAVSRAAAGFNLANLRPSMPIAAVTVFPTPIVRTRRISFQLSKEQGFQRVGPFLVRLTKADEKRQTFTLTLQTKDGRVDLQDRALAETIRLNPADDRPSEILVNRIDDNRIEGLVKVQTVTN